MINTLLWEESGVVIYELKGGLQRHDLVTRNYDTCMNLSYEKGTDSFQKSKKTPTDVRSHNACTCIRPSCCKFSSLFLTLLLNITIKHLSHSLTYLCLSLSVCLSVCLSVSLSLSLSLSLSVHDFHYLLRHQKIISKN